MSDRAFTLKITRKNGDKHLIMTDSLQRANAMLQQLKSEPDSWVELSLEGPKGLMEEMS